MDRNGSNVALTHLLRETTYFFFNCPLIRFYISEILIQSALSFRSIRYFRHKIILVLQGFFLPSLFASFFHSEQFAIEFFSSQLDCL